MTKHKKKIFVIVVFLISTIVSTIFFVEINKKRLIDANNHNINSFTMVLDLTNKLISTGYFQWDEMYNAFDKNNYDFIFGIFNDIYNLNKYISVITINRDEVPDPNNLYYVKTDSSNVYVDFTIFDSLCNNYIKNELVRIKINKEMILSDIQLLEEFNFTGITPTIDFAYNLKVHPLSSRILFFQLLSALAIGALASLIIHKILYGHANYFYESRGLEKIIFLFEQTEKYSANHSKNVATLAETLGIKMGFKGKKLKDLKVAALLHDIGKISIPREILNKPGKLTPEEFEIVKKHTILSDNIIKSFEELAHLRPFIKFHHEKIDGSGYPFGLKGEDIPIQSRIISIADIFEALTGDRPYREPLPPHKAVELMKTMSLDKEILTCLISNLYIVCKKIHKKYPIDPS